MTDVQFIYFGFSEKQKVEIILSLESSNKIMREALEMIADDEKPWHTCDHADTAQEALSIINKAKAE